MAVPMRFMLCLHAGQALQNTAILLRLVGLAALAQSGELLFELHELVNSLIHMSDVLIKHVVDAATAILRSVSKR